MSTLKQQTVLRKALENESIIKKSKHNFTTNIEFVKFKIYVLL